MTRRRPREEGPRRPRPLLASLATYCFLIAPFVWSSQQQEHHRQVDSSSNNNDVDADSTFARAFAQRDHNGPAIDVDLEDRHYKYVKDTHVDSDNPSALQTFAPAARHSSGGLAVRAPSTPAQVSGKQENAGISSLLHARSLRDWEIEDLILLATVDGSIYARDRKTGAHRWGPILAESPVVETIYHRENSSSGLQYQYDDSLNDFLWIVEPVQDGDIYLYNKAQHGVLQKLHMTVKGLQEKTPHASQEPAVVYVAEKTTTLFNFDAATGEWLRAYGGGRSRLNDKTTCRVEGLGGFQEQECGLMGSLTLGRVTYTIYIEHRDTAEPICTLKYSEWVPNTRDGDLHMQHKSSMDKSYVYSGHDGRILALRHEKQDKRQPLWTQKLSSPVVRVFDVARPANSDGRDTELVILPQPVGPMNVETFAGHALDANRVFLNRTSGGGWYALSEQMYPTVTSNVDQAQCYDSRWLGSPSSFERLTPAELNKVLIGVHPLAGVPDSENDQGPRLSIGGPSPEDNGSNRVATPESSPPSPSRSDGIYVSKSVVGFLSTVTLLFVGVLTYCLVYLDRAVLADALRKRFAPNVQMPSHQAVESSRSHSLAVEFSSDINEPDQQQVDEEKNQSNPAKNDIPEVVRVELPIEQSNEPEALANSINGVAKVEIPTTKETRSRTVSEADKTNGETKELHVRIVEPEDTEAPTSVEKITDVPAEESRKRARRGTRGGKAHRRKNKNSKEDVKLEEGNEAGISTETVVEKALDIEKENAPKITPDAVTVIPSGSDPTRVDDKTLRIGQLTVMEDKVLGFGSHGTRVFRGSFGGRDVAVKVVIKQLYDIASHEVNVLQESDDHPNVIRYYMMESAGDFMYIALELCPASLAEVIDKPMSYSQLFGPSGIDVVDSLRQITMGIRHLHSLKIVHRDIKPENILIAAPKRLPTRPDFVPPARLLISDFGLCKKLEVDQSSFRATTAHAAGTSGWRAPELLVDDENEEPPRNESNSGTQHSTNSEPVIVDTSTNRRVTRAIDIFALGCVFYYVLSKGNHPFDGKGRGEGKYMREANIIRGNHMLDDLSILGAYQGEADDLISRMLAKKPKERPDATQVLAHPFFWSAADRLDFLCHVSDQFEFEPRDPPSYELQTLESVAPQVITDCRGDFLRKLPMDFVATLGKQRKYKGDHMLDLLRALRNKKNHYEDMPDSVKAKVGSLPEGYLIFWTERFPKLLMMCHQVVQDCGWEHRDRFRKYYQAP